MEKIAVTFCTASNLYPLFIETPFKVLIKVISHANVFLVVCVFMSVFCILP